MDTPIITVTDLGKRYQRGFVHEDFLAAGLVRLFQQAGRRLIPTNGARNGNSGVPAAMPTARRGKDVFWALKDVSFTVNRGEIIGIIGCNGSGKSTLLKILSRITDPTAGEVRIRGRVASLLEVGTGFHPELSGRENIYLNGAILGMTRRQIHDRFDEIVAFAEIEAFIDTPVKRYSSGMYVRLAFAVAAHLDPDILLVDEVLAVGDVAFQKKCLGKMGDIVNQGKTILFVSHNMNSIRRLCSKAILLEHGRIADSGDTNSIVTQYLHVGDGDQGVCTYQAVEDKPELPLQILRARLCSRERVQQTNFEFSESVCFEIEYVTRKPLAAAVVHATLIKDGEIIALTFDTDLNPALAEHRGPGRTTAFVELPSCFLKPGHYGLTFRTGLLSSQTFEQLDNVLRFFVYLSSADEKLVSYAPNRSGLCAMAVKWDIDKSPEDIGI